MPDGSKSKMHYKRVVFPFGLGFILLVVYNLYTNNKSVQTLIQKSITNDDLDHYALLSPTTTTRVKGAVMDMDRNISNNNKVVVATKVLGEKEFERLKIWICFINHAFNDKKKYDFLIFTTLPFSNETIHRLQQVAKPANLIVSLEGPSLEEQLAQMTEEEYKFLHDRCGATGNSTLGNSTLTWNHYCLDKRWGLNSLAYNWQAEFRAYHIWKHPALESYKYMMWFDADAYVGKTWDVDPIEVMIKKNLTLMYACFPYSKLISDKGLARKLMSVYNVNICNVYKAQNNASIHAEICVNNTNEDAEAMVLHIGGNHHITNLDVYRSDIHQTFLKKYVGDYRFDRNADDQGAVTIVAVMEQYLRQKETNNTSLNHPLTYHERSNGMILKIAHHAMYDCVHKERNPWHKPKRFFRHHVKSNWTGLKERCEAYISAG